MDFGLPAWLGTIICGRDARLLVQVHVQAGDGRLIDYSALHGSSGPVNTPSPITISGGESASTSPESGEKGVRQGAAAASTHLAVRPAGMRTTTTGNGSDQIQIQLDFGIWILLDLNLVGYGHPFALDLIGLDFIE